MQIYFDRTRFHCKDCGIEFQTVRQTVNTEIWDNVTWNEVQHLNTETCTICEDVIYSPANMSLWSRIVSKICSPKKGPKCPKCKSKNTFELSK